VALFLPLAGPQLGEHRCGEVATLSMIARLKSTVMTTEQLRDQEGHGAR
jgi:hypothetical protein